MRGVLTNMPLKGLLKHDEITACCTNTIIKKHTEKTEAPFLVRKLVLEYTHREYTYL